MFLKKMSLAHSSGVWWGRGQAADASGAAPSFPSPGGCSCSGHTLSVLKHASLCSRMIFLREYIMGWMTSKAIRCALTALLWDVNGVTGRTF